MIVRTAQGQASQVTNARASLPTVASLMYLVFSGILGNTWELEHQTGILRGRDLRMRQLWHWLHEPSTDDAPRSLCAKMTVYICQDSIGAELSPIFQQSTRRQSGWIL
jgi:hypothetical protein